MNESTEFSAMAHMPNEMDDLDNLFEFGDIDLNNIPDGDGYGDQMQQHSHPGTHPSTPFQDMSQPPPMSTTSAHDFGAHDPFGISQSMGQQQQQQFVSLPEQHVTTTMSYTPDGGMYQHSPHVFQQQQQAQAYQMHSQQGFTQTQQIVPPTPNSFDMHGMSARFMDQQQQQLDAQQRALLAQRFALRKEEMAFTPMVSPAGTPQFNMLPEFTTPGAYFSPLTSPMLRAQNQQQQQHMQQQYHQRGYNTNPSTAHSSNTNSPVDPNQDVDMLTYPQSAGPQPRKSARRKIATAKGVNGRSSHSTSAKAQKRKSFAPSQDQPQQQQSGDDLSLRAVQSQPASAGLQLPSRFDSSEAESISPEPLSESLMGPPPRPGSSLTQSPALAAQQHRSSAQAAAAAAATPKSLLTMRNAQQHTNGTLTPTQSIPGSQELDNLDDLALPEATINPLSQRPAITRINTQTTAPVEEDDTPRMSARKTPKLGPLSTPSSARPSSAIQSPVAMSPMTGSTPSAILRDKKDGKAGKATVPKKRGGSMSTKMMSPALVPKISPSIKPLLPEGTPLNTATHALLLASKSNYQNLLDGTRLPGVSYPDSLSTGLTSKRTSHKVAEQGRRNRINDALKEMQSLIPKSSTAASDTNPEGSPDDGGKDDEGEKDGKGGGGGGGGGSSNSSKAATVEAANEYIRRMQREHASAGERIARLEKEKADLMKRLEGEEAGG